MKAALLFINVLIIITHLPAPLTAVDISFSEPYWIENEVGPYWPADEVLEANGLIAAIRTCPGITYDLIIIGNFGGCLINRIDHAGNLIDTASLYIGHIELSRTLNHEYKVSTWSDPYYYILTLHDGKIYYTRITDDLVLIDDQPIEYIENPRRLFVDGDYLWTIGLTSDGHDYISRYQLPSPVPILSEIPVPSQAANAEHIVGGNGLWFCDRYYGDTLFFPSYMSPTGQLYILDTIKNERIGGHIPSYNFCLLSYDSVTAYFCWFERPDSGNYQLQYIKISPISPSTAESELINLACLPRDYGSRVRAYMKTGNSLSFVIDNGLSIVNYVRFDPILEEVTDCGSIPNTTGYTDPKAIVSHDSIALMYNIIGMNVEIGTITPDNPFGEYHPQRIIYHSAFYTNPTLLADSNGILLYNQRSTIDSVSIIGNRFDTRPEPLVPSVLGNVIYTGDNHRAPWLYDLGDRKALYWNEFTQCYEGRLTFFRDDSPQNEDIDNRIVLRCVHSDTEYADPSACPALLRIDSLLYIAHFRNWSYFIIYNLFMGSTLQLYNLKEGSLIPWGASDKFGISTAGRFTMVPSNDTAIIAAYKSECIDIAPSYCKEYYCVYLGSIWHGTNLTDFIYNEPALRCGAMGYDDYLDHYSDIFSVHLGGQHLIWRECSLTLMKVNVAEKNFETVVDLQAASGINFGYSFSHPYTLNPVKLDDGFAVFMINNLDPSKSHLLVFDNQWTFKGHTCMPMDGTEFDFSQFQYCQQDGQVYFAYSKFLSKPYSAPRVFLQSASIENITDINENPVAMPKHFSMKQNSPNPFNAATRIEFYLPRQVDVDLSVYNVLGQKVITLINQILLPGNHTIFWDGTDYSGNQVASGVYFYRISAGPNESVKKMVLIK